MAGTEEDHAEERHAEPYGKKTEIGIMGKDDASLRRGSTQQRDIWETACGVSRYSADDVSHSFVTA